MAEQRYVEEWDDHNFSEKVKSGTVLVDFFADWCGPCRQFAPIIEEVAEAMKGEVTVAKMDIEKSSETAGKFKVSSVPTVVLFKEGCEVGRFVGLRQVEEIKAFIAAS